MPSLGDVRRFVSRCAIEGLFQNVSRALYCPQRAAVHRGFSGTRRLKRALNGGRTAVGQARKDGKRGGEHPPSSPRVSSQGRVLALSRIHPERSAPSKRK